MVVGGIQLFVGCHTLTYSQTSWNAKSRAIGSIATNKASGGGIPAELFQFLKDDAVKVLHSICQQIWKPQQDFPGGSEVKVCASNAGDLGLISGLGRSPEEGNGNPLQYSSLENPMDVEA